MRILIVEGNDTSILERCRNEGLPTASKVYEQALSLHAPSASFDVAAPFCENYGTHTSDLNAYDAFALTGSGVLPWCASDAGALPYMTFIERVIAAGKPIVASCWGLQAVVCAMGGRSEANLAGTEAGLAQNIRLTEKGRAHWIFQGMPDVFSSPCIHRDHITRLPECFSLLASNPVSEVQAINCETEGLDFIGFQYHPEFTFEYISALAKRRNIKEGDPSYIASFPNNLPKEVSDRRVRTQVFKNWIGYVQHRTIGGDLSGDFKKRA